MSNWDVQGKNIDDIIAHLLSLRGIISIEDREKFLSPDWDRDIHDPFIFQDMQNAVECLFEAINSGKKIMIHGDYDADGICGATTLFTGLEELISHLDLEKAPIIEVFLPDREKDGYGVAMHNIDNFIEQGIDVLITVDCGISNIAELQKAHDAGIQAIVCDHHQLASTEPENAFVIHPLASGESYPNKHLCGTGVAFKLICGLFEYARKNNIDIKPGAEKWYLDLVAIATVTDVMPILGENRVLEHYGLIVLEKTRRLGLKRIIQQSNIKSMDTEAIGFRIGPRINAAGRIGQAITAFEALTAKEPEVAEEKMYSLEQLNRQRQKISNSAYEEAKRMVEENNQDLPINIVWNHDWHPGIVGLIAGKLTTEFGVPAFALTSINNAFVGSGRSVGGLHLVEAMRSCGDIFIKAGGHPQACGLTIASEENIKIFKTRMIDYANNFFANQDQALSLKIDLEIPLAQVDWSLLEGIEKLKPFGQGNEAPVFASRRVSVLDARTVGKKNEHLKLTLFSPTMQKIDAIGFSLGSYYEDLLNNDIIDIAYELGINEWNGRRSLQLMLKDIKI